jgi:hypothetical protein
MATIFRKVMIFEVIIFPDRALMAMPGGTAGNEKEL